MRIAGKILGLLATIFIAGSELKDVLNEIE